MNAHVDVFSVFLYYRKMTSLRVRSLANVLLCVTCENYTRKCFASSIYPPPLLSLIMIVLSSRVRVFLIRCRVAACSRHSKQTQAVMVLPASSMVVAATRELNKFETTALSLSLSPFLSGVFVTDLSPARSLLIKTGGPYKRFSRLSHHLTYLFLRMKVFLFCVCDVTQTLTCTRDSSFHRRVRRALMCVFARACGLVLFVLVMFAFTESVCVCEIVLNKIYCKRPRTRACVVCARVHLFCFVPL